MPKEKRSPNETPRSRKSLKSKVKGRPPPIVYHSISLPAINDVVAICQHYVYNAATKMDEQAGDLLPAEIAWKKQNLLELQTTQQNIQAISDFLVKAFKKFHVPSPLEKVGNRKNSNFCRKFGVFKDFVDDSFMTQTLQNLFIHSQKIVSQYWLQADLFLILSTKIAYAILRHFNKVDSQTISLDQLNVSSPSNEMANMTLVYEDLEPALSALLAFCMDLWSMRESFSQEMFINYEQQRLKLCSENLRASLHRRRKHLKSLKSEMHTLISTTNSESETLYGLASKLKKNDSRKMVKISSVEVAKLQDEIQKGRGEVEKSRNLIEQSLEENKKDLVKNAEYELYEREKRRSAATIRSPYYNSQINVMQRLKRDRHFWKQACDRRIQRVKCMTTKTYLKNGSFKQKMSKSFLICPQRIRANRGSVIEALERHNSLLAEVTKKRVLSHHSTISVRNQWSEHNEFMELTLNFESFNDAEGPSLKERLKERVKKDMDESLFSTNRSFTITFALPTRLKPPFPNAQHEAMLAHRANAMANESGSSLRKSLGNKNDTPKADKRSNDVSIRTSDAFDPKNGKSGRRKSKSPQPPRAYPSSADRDKNKKSEKSSPYSTERYRRGENNDRRSARSSDYDAREKKNKHLGSVERESSRRSSRRNSPEDKYRKRKTNKDDSPDSRHASDKDRKERKKVYESRSSSSLSNKRRKTDNNNSPNDPTPVKPESKSEVLESPQPSLKPCDMPIAISSSDFDSITDDDTEEESKGVYTTLNVPKSVLLVDFKDFLHNKEMRISLDNIPKGLFESLKHIFLPENLQRPIYFPPEMENLIKMKERITSQKDELPENMKNLLERLTLKHFIEYCRNEQEHILSDFASTDFLDYRVYPSEIVRQIYHNISSASIAYNELKKQRKYEYQITKAKYSGAIGFSNLLWGCTDTINTLYKNEMQELSCIEEQTRMENAYKFKTEHVKYLQELRSHLNDYCSGVNIMESKHQNIKELLEKWKNIANEKNQATEKREATLNKAKQRISSSIEEKKKKLAELRAKAQSLSEDHIKSTIKKSDDTVILTRLRLRYKDLQDKLGQSNNASGIDKISELLYKHYKEMLFCPTCKVRMKDHVLTKCYHLFCGECLDKLFKSRNRKCPECNARIGANDRRRVYI